MADCGADLKADIVRGLYQVSRWLSEDSLGAARQGAMPEREESPLDGLMDALKKARNQQ